MVEHRNGVSWKLIGSILDFFLESVLSILMKTAENGTVRALAAKMLLLLGCSLACFGCFVALKLVRTKWCFHLL